jgi:hypothetical protein
MQWRRLPVHFLVTLKPSTDVQLHITAAADGTHAALLSTAHSPSTLIGAGTVAALHRTAEAATGAACQPGKQQYWLSQQQRKQQQKQH